MPTHGPASRRLTDSDFDLADDLGFESHNQELRDLIADEIRTWGPITFHRFMQLALYHPSEGYYTAGRTPIGRDGDYVTSPELSPVFGYAIARQLGQLWRCAGSPARFEVREFGAGNGRLARDILRWAAARDEDFQSALAYTLVELGDGARAAAQEAVGRWVAKSKARVVTAAEAESLPPVYGVVLANELLDSLPVHRVTVRDGSLMELFVDVRDGAFVDVEARPSSPEIKRYFDRLGVLPGEGCIAEVNLKAAAWIQSAASMLDQGYIFLFDYGYPAERLYASWRRNGTLLCYHRHDATEDPYVRVGRQDLTAHVDFSTISATAREAGLEVLAITTQNRLLSNLGLFPLIPEPGQGQTAIEAFYARKRAVEALLDPFGLGRIGVMLFGKNVSPCPLDAFQEDTQASIEPTI